MHRKQLRISFLALGAIALALLASGAHAERGRRVAIDMAPAAWNGENTIDFSAATDLQNSDPVPLPGSMVLTIGTRTYTRVWINKNGFITLGDGTTAQPVQFGPSVTSLGNISGDVIAAFYSDIAVRTPDLSACNMDPLSNICDVTYAMLDLTSSPPPDAPIDPTLGIRMTWGFFGDPNSSSAADQAGVVKTGTTDQTNRISFQIKMLDRHDLPDGQVGDFDLELNYGTLTKDGPSITWEGSPSLVGVKAGGVLLDFAKFYTSFLDNTPSAITACAGDPDNTGDPAAFDRARPLSCNSITIEFRGGKANLKTYTSDISASIAAVTGSLHTSVAFPLTLTVSNAGTDPATNVGAAFDVTSSATLVSSLPSGANCQQTAAKVNCTIASIASGASSDVTLNIKSTQAAASTYTATVSADQYDPALGGNSAGTQVTLAGSADLSITGCNRPTSVTQGNAATVTCTVKNDGPQAAANVVMEGTLPTQVTFASGANCSSASGKLTCTSASLASGATIDFSATLNTTAAGSAGLSMAVHSDTFDPTTNSAADATFTVAAPPPTTTGGSGGSTTPPAGGGGGGGGAFTLPWLILLGLARGLASRRRRAV